MNPKSKDSVVRTAKQRFKTVQKGNKKGIPVMTEAY